MLESVAVLDGRTSWAWFVDGTRFSKVPAVLALAVPALSVAIAEVRL